MSRPPTSQRPYSPTTKGAPKWSALRPPLGGVGPDVNLDAPVELTAVGRAVGGAGLRLAQADRVEAIAAHAELLEIVHHAVGAAFGKPLVVRSGADGVGVSRHFNGGGRVLLEHAGHL